MANDRLTRYLIAEGLKMSIVYTTDLTEEARALHDLSPVATAALGRAMAGALLLATDFKNKEGVSLCFDGDGPLGRVYADAYDTNKVRGYVQHPQTELVYKGPRKMDVGAAVGEGMLHVTRYSLLRQPYQTAIELVSGEIAEDLTYFLTKSEQIPSAVSLGVLAQRDGHVKAAGGILVQALPDVDSAALDRIEENLRKLGPMTRAMTEQGPEQILATLTNGLHAELLTETPVVWECTCSREKFSESLRSLPENEKEALLADEQVEMVCHYCEKRYVLTREELREVLAAKED